MLNIVACNSFRVTITKEPAQTYTSGDTLALELQLSEDSHALHFKEAVFVRQTANHALLFELRIANARSNSLLLLVHPFKIFENVFVPLNHADPANLLADSPALLVPELEKSVDPSSNTATTTSTPSTPSISVSSSSSSVVRLQNISISGCHFHQIHSPVFLLLSVLGSPDSNASRSVLTNGITCYERSEGLQKSLLSNIPHSSSQTTDTSAKPRMNDCVIV